MRPGQRLIWRPLGRSSLCFPSLLDLTCGYDQYLGSALMARHAGRSRLRNSSGFGSDFSSARDLPSLSLDSLILPLIAQGSYQEACQHLMLLRQSRSRNPQVYVLLGLVLSHLGDLTASIDAYECALALDPKRIDALVNLANSFAKSGRVAEAADLYSSAAAINDSYPALLFNYANFLLINDQLDQATLWLEHWLHLEPGNFVALKLQGYCLSELDQLERSRQLLQQSLELCPDDPEALAYLASTELLCGSADLALSLIEKAYALDSSSVPINLVLGNMCLAQANWERAFTAFAFVSENTVGPVASQALYNSAFACFGLGQRQLGYSYMEYRFGVPSQYQPHIQAVFEPFDPLKSGGTVVLFSEQGFGDTLQFSRYACWLLHNQVYDHVILYVQSELVGLLQESMPDVEVQFHGNAPNPLLSNALALPSCPHFFGENQSEPLLHRPYLKSSSNHRDYWRQKLRQSHPSDVLIAICWQGNPLAERTQNRGRSAPLESFLSLADLPGIRFVSLQKGFGREQLDRHLVDQYFVECQEEVSASMSFEDSASILDCCDLMISTDTGPAHLCGALGKPLWLLLSHRPDWRWGPNGECTFWYQNLTIFRQSSPGDWDGLIATVRHNLLHCLAAKDFSPMATGELS